MWDDIITRRVVVVPSGSPLDHHVLRFTAKAAEVAFLVWDLQYSAFGPITRPLKLKLMGLSPQDTSR